MRFRISLRLVRFFLFSLISVHLLVGCGTTRQGRSSPSHSASHENLEDEISALQSVAGAISGKTLTEDDMKNLAKDLRSDEDAKSAVQAITQSMNSPGNVIKYCPIDGARFSAKFTTCPTHGVVLKEVE